jgi:hypothetical protein
VKRLGLLAAITVALASCSLVTPSTIGNEAEAAQAGREAVVAALVEALELGDAQAIEGLASPVVDASADAAALVAAHGGSALADVSVEWGPLDFGEQIRSATITATDADGALHVIEISIGWEGSVAYLGIGAAPGVDPGADTESPTPVEPGTGFGSDLTCPGDTWPPPVVGSGLQTVSASARDSATIEVRNHSTRTRYFRVSGWEVVDLEACRGLVEREIASVPLGPGLSTSVSLADLAARRDAPLTVSVYDEPCGEGGCRSGPRAVILVPRSPLEPASS